MRESNGRERMIGKGEINEGEQEMRERGERVAKEKKKELSERSGWRERRDKIDM